MSQRWVVKLGTSTLTGGTPRLNRPRLLELVRQMARFHAAGHQLVIVSSGAVAVGREQLNPTEPPRTVTAKQMLSAIGQARLMGHYHDLFGWYNIVTAQVLLTWSDLSDRTRYLNARDTLLALIEHRVVPIINENDTTAVEEIKVGDNDNLSALVANLVEADRLVLLTDQPGLFTADPRTHADAQRIAQVERIDAAVWALAGGSGTALGTGGMRTKIQAAQLAAASGVPTVIAAGTEPNVLARLLEGDDVGTHFAPVRTSLESRKRWLLAEKPRGTLHIDAGAAAKLRTGGASLLPVGVRAVTGDFRRGEVVAVVGPDDARLAHGLTSYASADLTQLCGARSERIAEILGYTYGDAAVHRNNLVLLS